MCQSTQAFIKVSEQTADFTLTSHIEGDQWILINQKHSDVSLKD